MTKKGNLIPQAHTLSVEEQSKGGKKSAEVRREKKTIQKLLSDYLDNDINGNKELEKLAKKAGIKSDKSIKELVTAVCLLNTLKEGDVTKLQKIMELLGESVKKEDTNADVEQTLAVIRECAYADRDKS